MYLSVGHVNKLYFLQLKVLNLRPTKGATIKTKKKTFHVLRLLFYLAFHSKGSSIVIILTNFTQSMCAFFLVLLFECILSI